MQKTNIEVDKARLLRRVIFISWASLALCFVIKIFGGNFFEIICDNPNYKALCEYSETHIWLDFILSFTSSYICQSFYILSILQKYKYNLKEFILTTVSVIASVTIRYFNTPISILFDIWLMAGLPILLLGKQYKKYWQVLIAWFLTFAFQFISLIVKDLAIKPVDENIFLVLIYGIDVYIMCFLYYLYRNFSKKEQTNMGRFWVMFMGKPVDKLKAMKEKREAKIKKLEAEINAIEQEIEKQNKNDK